MTAKVVHLAEKKNRPFVKAELKRLAGNKRVIEKAKSEGLADNHRMLDKINESASDEMKHIVKAVLLTAHLEARAMDPSRVPDINDAFEKLKSIETFWPERAAELVKLICDTNKELSYLPQHMRNLKGGRYSRKGGAR